MFITGSSRLVPKQHRRLFTNDIHDSEKPNEMTAFMIMRSEEACLVA